MADFKTPLAVVVAYDRNFNDGHSVYEDLYHLLCRNAKEPFVDGLDIPVFYQTNQENGEITDVCTNISADKIVVLLLIDLNLYNNSSWDGYIDHLVKQDKAGELKVYPVALCDYAFDIHPDMGDNQYIRLKSFDLRKCWQEFLIRFYDDLIRTLCSSTEKLQIFISHTKKDSDFGLEKAEELKAYLRADTKLNSFFDANDILDGHSFGDQIKENLKRSLLIILETSTYSEREWCRIEAIVGKKNFIPTVVVSLFNGQIARTFPYLGNTPKIRFNDNWEEVIVLLLRTALDKYVEEHFLTKFLDEESKIIPMMPEIINVGDTNGINKILYPEPPLGQEELEIVQQAYSGISFRTPSQFFAQSKFLDNKNIAISISESSETALKGIGKVMFDDIAMELARHLLNSGAHLVYGGDLRPDGYTENYRDLAYQYSVYEKDRTLKKYFTNFIAWPIFLNLSDEDKAKYKSCRVNCKFAEIPKTIPKDLHDRFIVPNSPDTFYLWAESLSSMRNEMEEMVNARIILGGRTQGFKGYMPGLYEEAAKAASKEHPLFLLGGFGGAASRLVKLVQGKISPKELFEECLMNPAYKDFVQYLNKEHGDFDYSSLDVLYNNLPVLRNGLSEDENNRLFVTTNITEIVALILKGLYERFV